MKNIFTSTTTSSALPEDQESLFIRGYESAAPEGYDAAADCAVSPQPWCCPWHAMSQKAWQSSLLAALAQTGGGMAAAGAIFAREDFAELKELLAEEQLMAEEEV